jgi:hypothetical protein
MSPYFGPRLFLCPDTETARNNHKEEMQPKEDCMGERFSAVIAVSTNVYKTKKNGGRPQCILNPRSSSQLVPSAAFLSQDLFPPVLPTLTVTIMTIIGIIVIGNIM